MFLLQKTYLLDYSFIIFIATVVSFPPFFLYKFIKKTKMTTENDSYASELDYLDRYIDPDADVKKIPSDFDEEEDAEDHFDNLLPQGTALLYSIPTSINITNIVNNANGTTSTGNTNISSTSNTGGTNTNNNTTSTCSTFNTMNNQIITTTVSYPDDISTAALLTLTQQQINYFGTSSCPS
jgi:hypothetical protein